MTGSVGDGARAAAWEGVSLPVRAVVRAGYCLPAEGGYAVDVEVVHPVTLAPAGERIEAVPMPPLWLGDDGRGLYAPPAAGQIVILGWVRGSRGHPYVAGYGGDRHRPPQAVPAGALVLTDGRGGSITMAGGGAVEIAGNRGRIHVDDLLTLENDAQNLRAVLVALIEALIGLTRVERFADPVFEAAGGFIRILDHSQISGPTLEPARAQINLFVDDVEAEFVRVLAADPSVPVHRPPERESWGGLVATLRDPDGNFVQLLQML